jgi:hypothetical protein
MLGIFRCVKWLSWFSNIGLPLITRVDHISFIYIYYRHLYIFMVCHNMRWPVYIYTLQYIHVHIYQFQIYIQFLIHQFQYIFNFKYIHCNIVDKTVAKYYQTFILSYLFLCLKDNGILVTFVNTSQC